MLLERFVLSLTWIFVGVLGLQWLRTLPFIHLACASGALTILPVLVDDCIQHRLQLAHWKTVDGVITR